MGWLMLLYLKIVGGALMLGGAGFVISEGVESASALPQKVATKGKTLSGDSLPETPPFWTGAEHELAPPRLWNCDRYVDEYRAWLDEGNTSEAWRLANGSFVDPETSEWYNWDTWLSWAGDQECAAGLVGEGQVVPQFGIGIGKALGAVAGVGGAGAAAANSSKEVDSLIFTEPLRQDSPG